MAKGARGFASMNQSRLRLIAMSGGKAVHDAGLAHEWTVDEAREAGRKGGLAAAHTRVARIAAAALLEQAAGAGRVAQALVDERARVTEVLRSHGLRYADGGVFVADSGQRRRSTD